MTTAIAQKYIEAYPMPDLVIPEDGPDFEALVDAITDEVVSKLKQNLATATRIANHTPQGGSGGARRVLTLSKTKGGEPYAKANSRSRKDESGG